MPISVAIVLLLAIVTLSYEQTIHAYPGGGGAYIVARDNIGTFAARSPGRRWLMDYILTVAVSISSGVAQIVSAFRSCSRIGWRSRCSRGLRDARQPAGRQGVRECLRAPDLLLRHHDVPAVGTGLVRLLAGRSTRSPTRPPRHRGDTGARLFLLLHAFSSGTTALTGVEAISNAYPPSRSPQPERGITLLWMSGILAASSSGSATWPAIAAVPSSARP